MRVERDALSALNRAERKRNVPPAVYYGGSEYQLVHTRILKNYTHMLYNIKV